MELFEKVVFYSLGGICGIVAESVFLPVYFPYIQENLNSFILIVSLIIGVLTSMVVLNIKNEIKFKKNNVIRDETVALITHEMKTGLTSTGWAIQLILQNYADKITAEDKKMLEGVVDSIYTTVMHSVNLLDISLLDIGKLSISLEWVGLEKVEKIFKEVIGKYTLGATKKNIQLISHIELDKNMQVEVDLLRIHIILENLLENAIQYTMGKKKEIHVNITNDASHLNIIVKDTGIGIPDEEKEKIFAKFYRAKNAREKLSGGSGIGLYMCEQYVKAHKGTINFESKVNEGTTFYIKLPLKSVVDVNDFLTKL